MDAHTLAKKIVPLAREIQALCEQGVAHWEPRVDAMIATDGWDKQEVERAFEHLLDLAQHDEGLRLFKKLCRAYWATDPNTVASYVQQYREMWDS